MSYAARFLQPIRSSLSAITSLSSPHHRLPFTGKFEQLRRCIKGFQPGIHHRASIYQWKPCLRPNHLRKIYRSGLKSGTVIFGASVAFGTFNLWPCIAYALDGPRISVDDHDMGFLGASGSEEDPHALLQLTRKLLLPVFLVLTVFMHWNNPIILVTKVMLVLLGTRPSPSSVYFFVEQLRRQSMKHQPFLYKWKSLHAKKVDVEDYTFLCLARVELNDQKFTLIGILGSWWVLPLPSCQGSFFAL